MVIKHNGMSKGMCVCPNMNSANSTHEINGSMSPPTYSSHWEWTVGPIYFPNAWNGPIAIQMEVAFIMQ